MRPPPPPAAPSRSERLQARLDEIADRHYKAIDRRARGECVVHRVPWPCRTYLLASEELDKIAGEVVELPPARQS